MLVIDGIDELGTHAQDVVLDQLLKIAKGRSDHFRLMIFGRRDARMVKQHLSSICELTIAPEHNVHDLERYIESQLQLRIDREEIKLENEAMANAILYRLIDGAQQM